ncbi:uncharacterized protein LOC144434364 [Glandiceps talaboti]
MDRELTDRCQNQSLNFRHAVPRRYLISVHFDNNGPNVQYESFQAGLKHALYRNRTIVASLFFTHWTQEGGAGRVRQFDETFDVQRLREVIQVATLQEFQQECNHSVHVLLVDPSVPFVAASYHYTVKMFRQHFDIKLPNIDNVLRSMAESVQVFENSTSVRCLGIYEPKAWKKSLPDMSYLSDIVNKFLVRAPPARKIANEVGNELCNGNPYLSMHWRNRSGEGCIRPGGRCQSSIATVNEVAERAARDIYIFMKTSNLSCIYVALPPFSSYMITILRNANISNVVSKMDIIPPKYPDVETQRNDNYIWSLVEQEICIRSQIFISTQFSSWSRQVRNARQFIGSEVVFLKDIITWRADNVLLKK